MNKKTRSWLLSLVDPKKLKIVKYIIVAAMALFLLWMITLGVGSVVTKKRLVDEGMLSYATVHDSQQK